MSRKLLFPPLVLALTCACLSPIRADLIGYWPLDGDATAAVGSDGSLVGTLGATFDRNFLPTGALSFDGSSYVEVPGGGGLDGATVGSISMWVQWIGTQDGACCNSFGNVLGRQSNGIFSNNILGLSGDDPTTAAITWQQASPAVPTITGTTPVGSEWAHVAVTFSQFGSELFLNGASQGYSFASGLNSDTTVPLTIGAWGGDGGGFATANIDDVAIFNDFLSSDQVLALATGSATPLTVGQGGPGPQPPAPPVPIVQAHASSEFNGRPAISAANGLGLQPDFSHVNNPPSTMWLTAAGDAAPFIGFDLGSTHSLEDIRIWNYNEAANPTCCLARGIADATILIAGEDGQFIPLLPNQSLAIAPGTATDFSETISLGNVPARYVMIQSNGNHGDPTYTGLSEVQFRGEPASGTPLPPVLPASIHSVSSSLGDGDGTTFRRFADNVVNKSGTFADWHSITPDGTMWLNRGSFATPSGLPADLEPEITFDLGSVQKVDRVEIWNYNEILTGREDLLNRGVNEFELLFAGEDLNFASLGVYQLAIAPGAANVDFSQVFDLFGIDARYIKLDILSSHGGDNGFVGLSEVRFYGVVPEPAGAMLWGTLLAFITTRWRRRRAN